MIDNVDRDEDELINLFITPTICTVPIRNALVTCMCFVLSVHLDSRGETFPIHQRNPLTDHGEYSLISGKDFFQEAHKWKFE